MVRDNDLWKTMKAENMVKEQLSDVWGSGSGLHRYKVNYLGEHINKHHNGIIASLGFR